MLGASVKKNKDMEIKQIIETTFIDLKKSGKGYLMIRDLSCSNNSNDEEKRKIKFTLFRSKYFKPRADEAISFSEIGIEVASKFDTIKEYEKSLQKPDYFKIITTVIAIGTFIIVSLTYFNDKEKKELKKELENKNYTIDSLKTNSLSNSITKHK